MTSPAKYSPVTRLDSMVLGSISDTFTPPLVMIASDTGRLPVMSMGKAFSSSTSVRRFCFVRELACISGEISSLRSTTGIMLRGSKSTRAFSMLRF